MKIHYFQRYHTKENVSTANTMLLLSRLYQYSPDRFFLLLKQLCYPDSADPFEPEIAFEMVNTPRSGGYESGLFAACGKMPPINTHRPTRASRSTCKQA